MKEDLSYVELGEVANVVMGQSPASTTIIEMSSQGAFPFLQGCAEFGDKYPNANSWCVAPTKVSSGESVLFSVRAPVGKINLAYDKYCIGRGLASIEPLNAKDLLFLYYIIGFNAGQFQRLSQGSTFDAIDSKNLGKFKIMFPKNSTERLKIVELLTQIDSNIEKTKSIIKKYKNIKQGMMQDLLTKGIDESGNIRSEENHEFKDSPIGRIPKEWDALNVEATVDSVMDFRGKTPLKIGMDWGGGEIPAISANNVVMGKIDLSKGTYYGSEALYKKWMVKGSTQKGDVIITMEAPLGNIAQIPNDDKYILSQRVLLLRTRSELLTNEYIAQVFMSDEFQKQLNKYASGTTAQGIQQAKLFELYIPVPKLTTEQKRICDYINTINKKICMEENYLKKLCFMKQGLMQDLLTGKVRVPLEEATG